jgi:hypothetical protein
LPKSESYALQPQRLLFWNQIWRSPDWSSARTGWSVPLDGEKPPASKEWTSPAPIFQYPVIDHPGLPLKSPRQVVSRFGS